MLGMGAVVLLDSTEMLVVGDLLVLVHEEGTLMPQGGEENHFMLLVRRIAPLSAHFMGSEWSFLTMNLHFGPQLARLIMK